MPTRSPEAIKIRMLHHIQNARLHLNCVRKALQSPGLEPLDLGIQQLEKAVECLAHAMQEARSQTPPVDSRVRSEIASLRVELGVVARLAEQGLQFHSGWAAMLAPAVGGYTARGESAPLAAQGQVCMEG